MKKKIKNLLLNFISELGQIEEKISVQDLSVFFSVLIATYTLKKRRQTNNLNTFVAFSNYHSEFELELSIIQDRFPHLIEILKSIESQISIELLSKIFINLNFVFEDKDDDFNDLISWSYQYLKRDLAKSAFGKVGKKNIKIQNSDLLFTTQFFTDKYMVQYLVDESLACLKSKDITSITVIDPASGGGNFLNYSFDCLYKSYKEILPNWTNQEIVDSILDNALLGYDLDHNLSQIASLSLFIKACEYAVPSSKTFIKIYGGKPNDTLGFLNTNITSNSINKSTFRSQISKVNTQKRAKLFVTNPPFMGRRDMDINLKSYLQGQYPESRADLCVSFMQRVIQLMKDDDIFGVVSQNSWMYLSTLKDFRKIFLANQSIKECVDLGTNAFEDINGEKTNIALCIIGNTEIKKSVFYNLKFKSISEKKRLLLRKDISSELTFELNQNQFLKNINLEFNYQLEHRFDNIEGLKLYSEFGKPMQGTSTGNNSEFVKYAWEVNGNSDWKLVSKGGGFSKWAGLNYYKVLWGNNAEFIKANKGSALRNIDKIPSTQLVYSDTGTLGLNVRILMERQVFIASGPGIQVLEGDKYAHLAFLNSRVATFLLKLINPKFTISAGYIAKIPVASNILDSKYISTISKECLELKKKYLTTKLPNYEFQHYDYSEVKDIDCHLEKLIIEDIESDFNRLLLESKIEKEIRKQYNFNLTELKELKSVVGESPFFNTKKTFKSSSEEIDLLISASIDSNCLSTSRAINGYSVGSESIFEDLSYKLDVNPKIIFEFIKLNIRKFKNTKHKYLNDFLHKLILNEIGIEKISIYKYDVINLSNLIESLKSKYPFLHANTNLINDVIWILQIHHKSSFYNKPLISLNDKTLTVGHI